MVLVRDFVGGGEGVVPKSSHALVRVVVNERMLPYEPLAS